MGFLYLLPLVFAISCATHPLLEPYLKVNEKTFDHRYLEYKNSKNMNSQKLKSHLSEAFVIKREGVVTVTIATKALVENEVKADLATTYFDPLEKQQIIDRRIKALSKFRTCFLLQRIKVIRATERIQYKPKSWQAFIYDAKKAEFYPLDFSQYFPVFCSKSKLNFKNGLILGIKTQDQLKYNLGYKLISYFNTSSDEEQKAMKYVKTRAAEYLKDFSLVANGDRFSFGANAKFRKILAILKNDNIKELKNFFPSDYNYSFEDYMNMGILYYQYAAAKQEACSRGISTYIASFLPESPVNDENEKDLKLAKKCKYFKKFHDKWKRTTK